MLIVSCQHDCYLLYAWMRFLKGVDCRWLFRVVFWSMKIESENYLLLMFQFLLLFVQFIINCTLNFAHVLNLNLLCKRVKNFRLIHFDYWFQSKIKFFFATVYDELNDFDFLYILKWSTTQQYYIEWCHRFLWDCDYF